MKNFVKIPLLISVFVIFSTCGKYINNVFIGRNLKNFLPRPNAYVIDTREFNVSDKGYFENSIIMPITFNYSRWFPAVINNGSNVVLICDENNYISALEQTETLGPYHIFGYAIYNEIVEQGGINVLKAEYNENTKKDVEKIVNDKEYL